MSDQLQLLKEHLHRADRRNQVRAVIMVVVPALCLVLMFTYSARRLAGEQERHALLTAQNLALAHTISAKDSMVNALQEKLELSVSLTKYVVEIGPDALKSLAADARTAALAERLYQAKVEQVPWHLNGNDPSEGFDSPGFARYILKQLGVQRADLVPGGSPEAGDLVRYRAGYEMFYFPAGWSNPSLVIGMTPFGVMALRPDFSQEVERLRLP